MCVCTSAYSMLLYASLNYRDFCLEGVEDLLLNTVFGPLFVFRESLIQEEKRQIQNNHAIKEPGLPLDTLG